MSGLEQSCPVCGRWEAAGSYCSWCGRRTVPSEWYPTGDLEARYRHFPAAVPASPPTEYRRQRSQWPQQWGQWPGQDRPTNEGTPVKPAREARSRVSRPSAVRPPVNPRSPQ